MKNLSKFLDIMNEFIEDKRNAKEFCRIFGEAFYAPRKAKLTSEEFILLDELWGWLDRYEPNPNIREDQPYIDETELKKRVIEYKQRIESLYTRK